MLNAGRLRRIVRYNLKTHPADVQVTPQWHQWLRHVRPDPPSVEEQQQDVLRQRQIKQLARLADERWASKPSFLEQPRTAQQPAPATKIADAPSQNQKPATSTRDYRSLKGSIASQADLKDGKETTDGTITDPWVDHKKGGPSEKWQPESWNPSASQR